MKQSMVSGLLIRLQMIIFKFLQKKSGTIIMKYKEVLVEFITAVMKSFKAIEIFFSQIFTTKKRMHIVIIFVLLSLYFLFFYKYYNLQILTEARAFIMYGGFISSFKGLVYNCLFPSGSDVRQVSMLSFLFMKKICGYNNVCINLFQMIIVAVSGVLIYIHSIQIFKKTSNAFLISLLWFFSLPVLYATIWQAVNVDKVAIMFSLCSLILSYYYINKENNIKNNIISNFLILIFVILAYNSKESSFFIMPLIIVQYFIYSENLKKDILKIIIPVFFSVYYLFFYFINLHPVLSNHVFTNSILENFFNYSSFLHNIFYAKPAYAISFLIITVFSFVQSVKFIKIKFSKSTENPAFINEMVYSFSFLILSISIVAKAKYTAVYYMFTPLVGFLFLLVSINKIVSLKLNNFIIIKRIWLLFCIIFISSFLLRFNQMVFIDSSYFNSLLKKSDNFSLTFNTVTRKIKPDNLKTYYIIYPENIDYHVFFLREPDDIGDKSIINFIYKMDGDYKIKYKKYKTINDLDVIEKAANIRSGHYIIIDHEYKLMKIITSEKNS